MTDEINRPPIVLQAIGYSNSGKTELGASVVRHFRSDGQRIAVIKHHGHETDAGEPDAKDTGKYLGAGAAAVSLASSGGLSVRYGESDEPPLTRIVRAMELLHDPDWFWVEGYKRERYPKIAILRGLGDLDLLDAPAVELVLAPEESLELIRSRGMGRAATCEWLPREARERIMEWIAGYLRANGVRDSL